jgi:hypothetical protein
LNDLSNTQEVCPDYLRKFKEYGRSVEAFCPVGISEQSVGRSIGAVGEHDRDAARMGGEGAGDGGLCRQARRILADRNMVEADTSFAV